MEFTAQQMLDLKDQEIELLKKELRQAVKELNHYKENYYIRKSISKAQEKLLRAYEEELLILRMYLRN